MCPRARTKYKNKQELKTEAASDPAVLRAITDALKGEKLRF